MRRAIAIRHGPQFTWYAPAAGLHRAGRGTARQLRPLATYKLRSQRRRRDIYEPDDSCAAAAHPDDGIRQTHLFQVAGTRIG